MKCYGNYAQVKEKIIADYHKSNVSLCDYFDTCTAPYLTIEETVKLFAELRYEIDGDSVIHVCEGVLIDLKDNTEIALTDLKILLYK